MKTQEFTTLESQKKQYMSGYNSTLSGKQVDDCLQHLIDDKSLNIGKKTGIRCANGATLLTGSFWFDWNESGKDAVWLFCKCAEPVGTIQNWQGMVGDLAFIRGRADAWNGIQRFYVDFSKAYTSFIAQVIKYGCLNSDRSPYIVDYGIYEYKGEQYMGIHQCANSSQFVHFNGLRSSDVTDLYVNVEECTKIA